MCGEPGEADELLQETYKRALSAKRKPASGSPDAVRPWMFTIMRHTWLNDRRRQSRLREIRIEDAANVATHEGPELLLHQKLLVSEVREAIDSLPVSWREIVVLRDIEDLSYAEIAGILGCPVGTVMSRLSRARAELRQLLAPSTAASWEIPMAPGGTTKAMKNWSAPSPAPDPRPLAPGFSSEAPR